MRFLSLLFFCFSFFLSGPSYAQIPKDMQQQLDQGTTELKKQITDLEKQIADAKRNKEDPAKIKELEDQLAMLKNQLSMISKITQTVSTIPKKTLEQINNDSTDDTPKFPKFNPAEIASLPKINSTTALINYISDLHNHFLKKINPELIASFKQIQSQLENDPEKMATAAISAWYSEAPAQSVLLITKAAMQPNASDLTMNNLGAILNMGGLELRSIPILNYLVNQFPNNAMILNNLGQAYAGVGDLNHAMIYFGRCLQIEPNHPQANNTAGQIELSRGNTSAASQYFRNSLNGAFTDEASRQVKFVDPEEDLYERLKANIRMPEYFNENKYNVPPQCQSTSEAEALTAIYKGYSEMIGNLSLKYHELEKEYREKTDQFYLKKAEAALALKKVDQPPFFKKGLYAMHDLMKKYKSDEEWLWQMDKDYETRRKEIFDNYQARRPGPECGAQIASINQYLREMADVTRAWQLKHTAFNKKYINQLIYWSFFDSYISDEFKMKFYSWVNNYLEEMSRIARTELWGSPCKPMEQGNTPAEEIPIDEPHCPIDLELKLIVGKIALNCERFSFGGGEIVKFKYEKNFSSKQSTLSIGIGATFEAGGNFGGGFKGSASIDLGETVFITLDGNNSFSDFGMNAKAEASVKASKESSLDLGNSIAKEVTRSSDIFGAEGSVKCSAGINSGLTVSGNASFDPGPLKALY